MKRERIIQWFKFFDELKELASYVEKLEERNQALEEENRRLKEGLDERPGKNRIEILDKKIFDLDLPTRTKNALEAARIETVRELVTWKDGLGQLSEKHLLGMKNFWYSSLEQVKRQLQAFGLRLGMTEKEIRDWASPPKDVT